MRAVLVHVTEQDLAQRRTTGLDRWDEVWDGVLHMAPAPNLEHQRIVDELMMFLGRFLKTTGRGTLRSGINVYKDASGQENYRIPDLTFVTAGREHVFHTDGIRAARPDAVIEIRSPEDETYEKLPFYAAIGTREVIVIDRDSKRPEIFRLAGAQYVVLQADDHGWLKSEAMGVRFGAIETAPPHLRIEDAADSTVSTEI